MAPRIRIGPVLDPLITAAVIAGGATIVSDETADAVIWTDPFDIEWLLANLTDQTRWVSLPAAGVDRFVAAGIVTPGRIWTATKGVYGDAVAEHAVALLLSCSRHIVAAARRSTWMSDPGWRLSGQTIAVLGTGGIGANVAAKLAPFGAKCIGLNRTGTPAEGFSAVHKIDALVEILQEARVAIVALPYTEATKALIGAEELDALGSDGILVNVARGEIVQTSALVSALADGRLGAAALDVTDPEPLPDDHPLWGLDNALVTPHTANPFTRIPWRPNVREYAEHLRVNVGRFNTGEELQGQVDLALGY